MQAGILTTILQQVLYLPLYQSTSFVMQLKLPRPTSDHAPILLKYGGGGVRSGSTPFRFENVWLKADSFQDLLKIWWQGMLVQGSLSFILTKNLKKIKW